MAYTLSLDYTLAKKYLQAMDDLVEAEIAASTGTVRNQLIQLQHIDVPENCKGAYANVTVEKLIQLNKEWQDLMLRIRDCKTKIANKVEQLHAYDMQQQAAQEKLNYEPISSIDIDKYFVDDYRANVNKLNSIFKKPQAQVYKTDSSGNATQGLCNVAAMERLLDRRCALDGHSTDTFSVTDVIRQSGGKITNNSHNGSQPKNKGQGIGYVYSGGTGKSNVSTYTSGDVSYQAKSIGKKTLTSAKGGADEYMTSLLNAHPEGVCVRTNGHVAVITDYEIIDGKVQYYVSDSFTRGNGINKSGRIKIEDSSLYKNVSKNTKFYNMSSFDYVSYLK